MVCVYILFLWRTLIKKNSNYLISTQHCQTQFFILITSQGDINLGFQHSMSVDKEYIMPQILLTELKLVSCRT
jgi:hypothetical protein